MKKFLLSIFIFTSILLLAGEILIRNFHLVSDIPERYTDEHNIQRYKPFQSGFYKKAKKKWNVNKYGWLGTHQTIKNKTISIIGDSFIENLMNPIECNQGSILKKTHPNYAFFEAGRSGVTFIEAVEISRVLESEVNPKLQLIYVSTSDFLESVSEIQTFKDRLQLSTKNKKLNKPKLKSPILKKLLYSFKTAYYLYLRFPIFVKKQNKSDYFKNSTKHTKSEKSNNKHIQELLKFCCENYNLSNTILVLHPNFDSGILELIKKSKIKTIVLDSSNDKSWSFKHDHHWTCYGHRQAAKQVTARIKKHLD